MGRLLAALRDSPTALEVHGTDVNIVRTVVFCISAALAGAAGALTGSLYGYAVGPEFDWFQSLVLAVLILIVVGGAPWYALLAAAGQVLIPSYVSSPTWPTTSSSSSGYSPSCTPSRAARRLRCRWRCRKPSPGWSPCSAGRRPFPTEG